MEYEDLWEFLKEDLAGRSQVYAFRLVQVPQGVFYATYFAMLRRISNHMSERLGFLPECQGVQIEMVQC